MTDRRPTFPVVHCTIRSGDAIEEGEVAVMAGA
jgi:hypothetical protein